MTSKLHFVANRRLYLFGLWLALVTACGLNLPPSDVSLSFAQIALVTLSGLATIALGLALAGYLFESWTALRHAHARFAEAFSLGMETLIAVPILLLCLAVPAVGAFEVLLHL